MTEGQLRWRCRRGMREMDQLLIRYLEQDYADSSVAQKSTFQAILALPDPELIGYLIGGQLAADSEVAHVIRCIQDRAHS